MGLRIQIPLALAAQERRSGLAEVQAVHRLPDFRDGRQEVKRYQIVLCAIATAATVAAFWCVCYWAYQALLAIALFLVFLALIALTF